MRGYQVIFHISFEIFQLSFEPVGCRITTAAFQFVIDRC
jgi:hypothetical protein